ncbi:MAG: hypothetical protein K5644_10130 [Lachnospiraceae bacterium]|nr:hypothetical protein [Lachnospiraceae bacterium]
MGQLIRKHLPVFLGIIAGILLIIFIIINASITGYEHVAKKYGKAMKSNDYDTAYSCLYTKDSVFLTKEGFLKFCSVQESYSNEEIETGLTYLFEEGVEKIINRLIGLNYDVSETIRDGDNAQVTFLIYSGIDTRKLLPSTATVHLKKSSSNHMGIFPDWRVVDEDILVLDTTLQIPDCDTAYIDGIEIPDSYLVSKENGVRTYNIPGLYTGIHVCSIKKGEEELKHYGFASNQSNQKVVVSEESLDEATQRDAVNACYEAFKSIITAEATGADFSQISHLFAPSYVEKARENFETDKSYFKLKDSKGGIETVNVKDVSASVYNQIKNDNVTVVSIKLNYNNSNTGKTNLYIFETKAGADTNNEESQIINMQLIDGKWLISSFGDNEVVGNNWFMFG